MLRSIDPSPLKVEVVTDPEELARAAAQRERFERNWAWFKGHIHEVYADSNRGRFVCIAGEELFVANGADEVVQRARAAHPEDDGFFVEFIPREKAVRIYADQR